MNNIEVVLTSVLAAIGGAALVVGGLAAWLGSVWKDRIERHESTLAQIDVDLRSRRITAYEPLWALTKVLPKWPRDEAVTYESLRQFSEDLRSWYFEVGGLYFSKTSRELYGVLQDELRRVLESGRTGRLAREPQDDYEVVRVRCSELRTSLATDVASRRDAIT
jgi:hypothetical protein